MRREAKRPAALALAAARWTAGSALRSATALRIDAAQRGFPLILIECNSALPEANLDAAMKFPLAASMHSKLNFLAVAAVAAGFMTGAARAEVDNLKVVTDASPDYSDLPSLIHSITAKWPTPKEQCWALFYWNHIARRQTSPMILHGTELTDPIRQFNDYGYTMCSTISGINCGIWHNMGLPVKFWDISLHTVPEVFYDGRWHIYDNSMSALYTLCDGKTIAGVEDIGRDGACAASGGVSERGHIARYHCLYSTGPNGFLTGADTQRSLDDEARCFNPNALKYRYYYFNWDYGHRYILNLKPHETYSRYYQSLGEAPEFYVPNNGKDPDKHYHLRGNGVWHFQPDLTSAGFAKESHSAKNITADPNGLRPAQAGMPAEVIFKVEGANVITSQRITANFMRKSAEDQASLAVSVNNGLSWTEVWKADAIGDVPAEIKLLQPVNGAYEVLLKASLTAKASAADVALRNLDVETTTMLNAKTQPRLNLGRNTIYVGAGDQTESVVFWPELQGGKYKEHIVTEHNVTSAAKNPGYMGTVHPVRASEDAYFVYRLDAPRDITRVNFGGRFYNRAPQSHIDLLYSLDGGQTWTKSWSLRRTSPPWDVIHYETVDIPKGHRTVWSKYLMNTTEPASSGCSIYAVRMEANYRPADTTFQPVQVTFHWSERQSDRSLVARSHTQTITKLPFKYTIDVGGADHPIVNWLRLNLQGAVPNTKDGYSDGQDVGGDKFVPQWLTRGRNIAIGKSYTLSIPSGDNWGAGDPDGKKLTTGAGGPSYAGGTSYRAGAIWMQKANPVITLDLGAPSSCASFGMNFHGYPWWDALKGQIKDKVEVLTSVDGEHYTSQGFLKTDLRWVDLPVNFMWPDDETMTSATFRCVPHQPVTARYVKYQVTNQRIFDCAGLEVLDSFQLEPFDLRIALPDEAGPIRSLAPVDDGSANSGKPAASPAPSDDQPHSAQGAVVPRAEPTSSKTTTEVRSTGNDPTATPLGEPVLEAPTLHSLGVYWIVNGDDNQNATVGFDYRKGGTSDWKKAMPLFRVERGANRRVMGGSRVKVPADAWLFAGSAVLLEPDTEYELRLKLSDPDGGAMERILKAHTRAEPIAPANAPQFHVVPGNGGGTGTASDPYRGLSEAQAKAKPGDIFLLHGGVYAGRFTVTQNGQPGQPIVWRGAGDGEAILDGHGTTGPVVDAYGARDVWFESLSIRNGTWGLAANDAERIVIRRCHFSDVKNGITATRNDRGTLGGFFISDNLLEGPFPWPSPVKGATVEEDRGIQISGTGQDVCYNRVRNFKDGIDTFRSPVCTAIDIHHNEISECLDDGCEMDDSERNTRCFLNRFTDVFQGLSVQPVHGGPVYVFRNAVFNIDVEPVKLHNSPSGVLLFHNTFVKKGEPLLLYTSAAVHHCVSRNNLFIGTTGNYAYECDAPMVNCDSDYDGFGGGPWKLFLKWNRVRYKTLADVKKHAPVYRHAVRVNAATVFASGLTSPEDWTMKFTPAAVDLRLKKDSAAVDAGEVLPGFNDGYTGQAPDLGAYEWGRPLPHYGPRGAK